MCATSSCAVGTGTCRLPSVPLLRGAAELAAEVGARQAFEFLLGRHLDANPRQYTLTPAELAALMADLAGPARTALDPACGTGALLRAVDARPDQELYAQDSAPELAALSALRLALHSRATVRAAAGDTLRADGHPALRADVVLCHPPFNERNWGHDELAYDPRWEYGFPARTESELAWVQHALARLTDGGTAVLLMPPAAASRRSGRRIRADLLRRGALRAVVALPVGAAPPYNIPLHLWVLRRPDRAPAAPEVLLVDTGRFAGEGRGGPDWEAVREAVTDAWHAFTRAGRLTERPGLARSVPVIDLLDDDVDLAPARHLPPAAVADGAAVGRRDAGGPGGTGGVGAWGQREALGGLPGLGEPSGRGRLSGRGGLSHRGGPKVGGPADGPRGPDGGDGGRPGGSYGRGSAGLFAGEPGAEVFDALRAAPAAVDFTPGRPDLTTFPRAAWLRAERAVLAELSAEQLGYGDPRGAPPLRRAVAEWLARMRGVRVEPDAVLIVAGTAQALTLLHPVLRADGVDAVAVEDPGSLGARQHLRSGGLATPPVPVDEEGVRVDALRATGARAVLLTPAHQFPTGVVTSGERRRELLEWARDGGLILEDDYDAEHRYDRPPVPALRALLADRVCYLGSVSKLLAPALRIGWLVAPAGHRAALVDAKRFNDLGNAVLPQLVLARLMESGDLERHLRLLRGRHRRRRDAMIAALAEHLPGARVHGAAAGLHLTVTYAADVPDTEFAAAALARGVKCQPLSWHRQSPGRPGLVLGYAATPPGVVADGVALLGRTLRALG
ncbi:aminotransferase class I/II-fold pyridoxal phosphate-dependent enzyme [Streptomyces sp. PBH53]|uniref:aminotransferase class I/II-fold pyridoxal phosphate-dependent enzyme n=1 Tax=Streptomyces sp. PBH53 TaxID=1577075 RepID=UPI003965BABA